MTICLSDIKSLSYLFVDYVISAIHTHKLMGGVQTQTLGCCSLEGKKKQRQNTSGWTMLTSTRCWYLFSFFFFVSFRFRFILMFPSLNHQTWPFCPRRAATGLKQRVGFKMHVPSVSARPEPEALVYFWYSDCLSRAKIFPHVTVVFFFLFVCQMSIGGCSGAARCDWALESVCI